MMNDRRLKAGVLGIDGSGELLLAAVQACASIELIALADRDRDLAKDRAAALRVEAYDDYRSLVVEQPIDVLFVSAPPFACHEQLKLSGSRGIAVWRQTPLARTVHEAWTLVKAFEAGGGQLAVARRWELPLLSSGVVELSDAIGRLYSARGLAAENRADPLGWRGDSERAGGGALIDLAYELVDAVVQGMGLPDEVQAVTTRRPGTQPYDTEDVATVTLRYQNGAMATILAHRRAWSSAWSLAFDGAQGSLTFEPDGLFVRSPEGERRSAARNEHDSALLSQIDAFAQAALTDAKVVPSSAQEHLATVAVIETAYLSARTGEPESPSHLYHLHDLPLPTPYPPAEDDEPEPEE